MTPVPQLRPSLGLTGPEATGLEGSLGGSPLGPAPTGPLRLDGRMASEGYNFWMRS